MGKRRSMMRKKKYDEAYNRHAIKPWSDLTHDVLFSVMMRLGVIDFLAFSRVCKPWRSLAVSNENKFIVSKPPMSIYISTDADEEEYYLEDLEGRKLKIIVPHLADRTCVGVTCGYLILFGKNTKTNDFWLVNPITRHELHFHCLDVCFDSPYPIAILVFSPSGWVLVVFNRIHNTIWFCIVGKREWTKLSTPLPIWDLIAFKGKIYAIHFGNRLSEVRLCPTLTVTLLEIKNFPKQKFGFPMLVTSGEDLYVIDLFSKYTYNIQRINFSEMEWMSCEEIGEEYVLFLRGLKINPAVTPAHSWVDLYSQYGRYALAYISVNVRGFHYANMWYFFDDCLNVIHVH